MATSGAAALGGGDAASGFATRASSNALRFSATWAHMRGLRLHLALQAARLRLPPLLALVALAALARSSAGGGGGGGGARGALLRPPSPLAVALLAALTYGVQRVASYVASVLIMPGQRAHRALFEWLSAPPGAPPVWNAAAELAKRRLLPAGARPGCRQQADMLRGHERELRRLREAMFAPRLPDPAWPGLGASRLRLATPDGGVIDGALFGRALLAPRAAGAAPWDRACRGVLVYFGGNFEHFECAGHFAQWPARHGLAVVLINYRYYGESGPERGGGGGSGGSGGSGDRDDGSYVTRESGVVDVATALAFVGAPVEEGGLGVPLARTVVLGHSIGGALSAEAALFFPGPAGPSAAEEGGAAASSGAGAAASAVQAPSLLSAAYRALVPGAAAAACRTARAGPLVVNDRSLGLMSTEACHLLPAIEHFAAGPAAATWRARAVVWAFVSLIRNAAAWEMDAVGAWRRLAPGRKLVVVHPLDGVIKGPARLLAALAAAGATRAEAGCVLVMAELPGDAAHEGAAAHNRALSRDELARFMRCVGAALDERRDLGDAA